MGWSLEILDDFSGNFEETRLIGNWTILATLQLLRPRNVGRPHPPAA